MNIKYNKSAVLLFFMLTISGYSQNNEPSIKMKFGKGIQFKSADSTFTLSLGGRIQSMFEGRQDVVNETMGADFFVRRCRLNFQGSAYDPRLTYRIQIGFSQGDITSANSSVQNNLILRDAMLFYKATDWLRIGFGQTKLPGNRQRQVSSANLQLVERSISNNNFTLDRDKGIWFYTKFKLKETIIKSTLAVSGGEGRINSDRNGKLCYSGRAEFLPLGNFTNNGDYIESAIVPEDKLKIAVAGALSYNQSATRTMGQLGEYLFNGTTANILYYGTDVMLKYKRFSFESEFYTRKSDTGIIINALNVTQNNHVIAGTGFFAQTGYLISKSNEIAFRYAQINPDASVASVMNQQKEYTLGFSRYFSRHNLKIQTSATYLHIGLNENILYRVSGVIAF